MWLEQGTRIEGSEFREVTEGQITEGLLEKPQGFGLLLSKTGRHRRVLGRGVT